MDPADIPLRDIHLPDPVSWWPPAAGWWWLAGLTALIIAATASVYLMRRRRRIARAARAELAAIRQRYAQHGDPHALARELSRLARRCTLALEPGRAAAAVTGQQWHDALARVSASGEVDEWFKTTLAVAPYQRDANLDSERLLAAFGAWIDELRPAGSHGAS